MIHSATAMTPMKNPASAVKMCAVVRLAAITAIACRLHFAQLAGSQLTPGPAWLICSGIEAIARQ